MIGLANVMNPLLLSFIIDCIRQMDLLTYGIQTTEHPDDEEQSGASGVQTFLSILRLLIGITGFVGKYSFDYFR